MRQAAANYSSNGESWTNTFERDGVAVIPNVLDDEQIEELIQAIERTPLAASARKRNQSTYAIRNLLQDAPVVRRISCCAAVRALVEPMLGPNAFAVRGLLFDKTTNANRKVAWHQDLSIAVQRRVNVTGFGPWSVKAGVIHVQPPVGLLESMLTLRLHLDDCDEHNGPLKVLPGSHTRGKLSADMMQSWRAQIPELVCLVKRGGVVMLRPLLLHASSAAIKPAHRRVIHLEFAAEPLPGGLRWLHEEAEPC